MKRFLPYILAIIFIEILIVPLIFRITGMGFLIIPNKETEIHILMQVIFHDSMIYALLCTLVYFSYLKFMPKIFSYILRTSSVIIFTIYIIDIYIINKFVTHININDINKYITYTPNYILQQYDINLLHILLLCILIIILVYFIKYHLILLKNQHIGFIALILLLLFINSFSKDTYVHSWVYKNFIEYNIDLLEQSKDYSEKFKQSISIDEKIICKNNNPKKINIIVLMVESFASYQSNYFSGIKNWTPFLDKIAQNNISIQNFYSNGFVTEDAEISMLTGLFPIYSPKIKANLGSTSFQGFYSIKDSLPRHLQSKNYITEFITSSDLKFSNTGIWAKSLGFDYIEGSKHPYYDDKKRYFFDAPADEFLFHRVLNRIDIKKKDIPYFLFVTTITSHIPFLNPENNTYSEEETIRYVDKQIDIFYKKLQNKNFFKNGLLIIVGDHHPMIPLKKEQLVKYGIHSAGVRVPFIASFGGKVQKQINDNFHQVDIHNSIKNFTSKTKCTSLWKGDFLSTNIIPPKFTVYRRGDKRGAITIFNKNDTYNLRLNGDKTKILNHKSSNITKTIINKINFERIKHQENEL